MGGLDADVIRHALQTARAHGFRSVRLKWEGTSFRADLDELPVSEDDPIDDVYDDAALPAADPIIVVEAPTVGYLRLNKPAAVGAAIAAGQTVAVVEALGLANDVLSPIDGELVEWLVEPDQPVEYGQPIAHIRRAG